MKRYLFLSLLLLSLTGNAQSSVALQSQLDSASKLLDDGHYTDVDKQLSRIKLQLDSGSGADEWYQYLEIQGAANFQRRNIIEANIAYQSAMRFAQKLDDSLKLAAIHSAMGNIDQIKGNPKEALVHYQLAAEMVKGRNELSYNGILMNMAVSYETLSQFDKALKNLEKVRDYFSKTENYKNLATAENNLGELYRNHLQDNSKAKEHYRSAIRTNKKTNHPLGLAQNYHNMAVLSMDMGQLDSATTFAMQSLKYRKQAGDEGGLATTYNALANINVERNDIDKAIEFYNQSLKICERNGILQGLFFNKQELGQLYLEQGMPRKAQQYLIESAELAEQSGNLKLQAQSKLALYHLYKQTQNHELALSYFEAATELQDSIANLKNKQALAELRTTFETNLAEAENEILKSKHTLQAQELSTQRTLLLISLGAIILILIAGIFLARALKQRNKAYREERHSKAELSKQYLLLEKRESELSKANDIKNNILSVLGHDLRGLLVSISTLLDIVQSDRMSRDEIKSVFSSLKSQTDLGLSSLEQTLIWARLQMNEKGKAIKRLNAGSLADEVVSIFENKIQDKNLTVFKDFEQNTELYADEVQVKSILTNLLSNAIKFSPYQGKINFAVHSSEEYIHFNIADQGEGISQGVLNNLNNRSKVISASGTASEKGTGIGLRIAQDFVKEHGGEISFEQRSSGGTRVIVSTPTNPPENAQTGHPVAGV